MEQRKTFLCMSVLVLLLVLVFPVTGISSTSESGYITVGLAPVANFNARYSYNTVPATVAFQDLSTGTTPMTYLWEFGDGATSTEQNPSHTYIRQGLYTVKLTVTNSYGASSETKTSFIAIGLGPRADFTGQPTTGNTPLTVAFTDRSTGNPTNGTGTLAMARNHLNRILYIPTSPMGNSPSPLLQQMIMAHHMRQSHTLSIQYRSWNRSLSLILNPGKPHSL